MIDLLNNSERRRLNFAELLSIQNDWMTLSELSNLLKCSERTLKDDIVYFRNNITDFKIHTSYHGIRLTFHHDKGLRSLYQAVLNRSVAYSFLETVFIYEGKTIPELADMLFTSSSTIYRLTNQINAYAASYDWYIKTNPCSVLGNEKNIRYFFYQYFHEKYSAFQWPYEYIDETALDRLLKFFIEFTQLPTDFAHYNIFKLVTVINLIRYKNDHCIHIEDIKINFDEIIPELGAFADIFQSFEQSLNIKFDGNLINQLFTPYVQEGFSLNYERLIEKAKVNKQTAAQVSYLSTLLDKISVNNDIPLLNKEEIITAMQNTAHLEYQEPQSGYILYNRNKYFTEEINKKFPDFYAELYDGMKEYRKLLNKPITENGVQFFIYTLFTFWENLVPELRKKFDKIKILVISDRHISHASMLKAFIEYEFSEQLDVDIYTDMELSIPILKALEYEIFVTNFPMSELKSKHTIYIENVPTHNDISKLQRVLARIKNKRNSQ